MARHFLELADAATVPTEAYLLTRRTVSDVFAVGAMGAVHGEAGTGKTFAVEEALSSSPSMETCWLRRWSESMITIDGQASRS